MKNKSLMVIGIVLGVVLFYVGYIYASHPAGMLPSFFPGYLGGSSHVHTTHSLAAFIVGLACFIFAWFQSGPKKAI